MSVEWLSFWVILLVAFSPFLRKRGAAGKWIFLCLIATVAGSAAAARVWNIKKRERLAKQAQFFDSVPREGRPGGYFSSDSCRSCHPSQYASWHRSYHRTMTQYAAPETVKGNFDGHTLEAGGELFRLERRGDEFWAEMLDPEWKLDQFGGGKPRSSPERIWKRIGVLTGSHHMQAYWVPSKSGNMQLGFPLTFLFEDQRWVPRNEVFLLDPSSPPPTQIWNANCIQCHATGGQPRPDPKNYAFLQTRVGELGIACEACHGPAQSHVKAQRNPLYRYKSHWQDKPDPAIVQPRDLSHTASSQVCGQCHGIKFVKPEDQWQFEGLRYRPGADLEALTPIVRPVKHNDETWYKELLRKNPTYVEDRYWSDGMVRISGREFNGLIETPCYQRGTMSCLSCHSMHQSDPDDQLAAGMHSNQACLQCHSSIRPAEHTRHKSNSSGSLCYNCHMPHTTYGLLKAIRSHHLDSPSVETSLKTGRPNACNLCHLDKTLEWTAKFLHSWYGIKAVDMKPEERSVSAAALWALRGEAGQRALMAWHMGWQPAQEASGKDWQAPYLAQFLDDPYSAVRYIAYRSIRTFPQFKQFDYDYLAPPAERRRARIRAMEQWQAKQPERGIYSAARPEILIEGNGSLQKTTWDRLLSERDNRSINLLE